MLVMRPDLDVIVVTYNSAHVIGDLLDSLPPALGALTADVIVVDNGSTDGTADFVAARGDCKVVRSANVGYAGGINRGVREGGSAEAILILNPDVRLGENAVPPLLKALHEPNVGIAAPQIRSPQGELEFSLRREPSLLNAAGLSRTGWPALSEHMSDPADYAHPRVVDWALGAVLLISRSCYDLLGGWDESFFLYSEETDFCLRARDLGLLTRYEPQSVAVHIGGGSGRSGKTHSMQIVNRVRLYRRRHTALASWFYYGLTIARELSWIVRGHRESLSAFVAVLRPARRPVELGCSGGMMPR
jgi:N-acetylglucosaminyl-diphospho-decaprenol L-rhamnosyltransferase